MDGTCDSEGKGGGSGMGGAGATTLERSCAAYSGQWTRGLLLPPSSHARRIELPTSLLQKALRRSTALCSSLPLLEACRALMGIEPSPIGAQSSSRASPATAPPLVAGADTGSEGAAEPAATGGADTGGADTDARRYEAAVLRPPRGGPFALFWTIATCALNDVAPCGASPDGLALGVAELIALALAAHAEPSWVPPVAIVKRAVTTALRLQESPRAEQWQGQCAKADALPPSAFRTLEGTQASPSTTDVGALERGGGRRDAGAPIRDALRCALATLGVRQHSKVTWRSQQQRGLHDVLCCYLVGRFRWAERMTTRPSADEALALAAWPELPALESLSACRRRPSERARLVALDEEARLAAHDQGVCRELLLLLQASLSAPPQDERKHSLLCLSRHVAKLSSNCNPRERDVKLLARVAEFRAAQAAEAADEEAAVPGTVDASHADATSLGATLDAEAAAALPTHLRSHREIVSATGTLSSLETELADALERWQRHRAEMLHEMAREDRGAENPSTSLAPPPTTTTKAGAFVRALPRQPHPPCISNRAALCADLRALSVCAVAATREQRPPAHTVRAATSVSAPVWRGGRPHRQRRDGARRLHRQLAGHALAVAEAGPRGDGRGGGSVWKPLEQWGRRERCRSRPHAWLCAIGGGGLRPRSGADGSG